MTNNSFEQFQQLVFEDVKLQSQLREVVDRDEFVKRAVELGVARGFTFNEKDVHHAILEGRRAWNERYL